VVDTATAPQRRPPVHDEAPDNRCYDWGIGDKAAAPTPPSPRPRARHHAELPQQPADPERDGAARGQRQLRPNADELHAVRGQPEPARRAAADVRLRAGHPRAQDARGRARRGRRLRQQDLPVRRETALVWASKLLGRPIKWTAERSEAFLSDAHGRDHVTTAELALDKDGKFLALRVKTTANLGAYLSTFASSVPDHPVRHAAGRPVRHAGKIYCEVKAVFTNTAPVDAYRGAGRPEATYVVERIVEKAARETGHRPGRDPPRNFIRPVPLRHAGGPDLRHRRLRRHAGQGASKLADVAGFAARKAKVSEAKGLKRGLGYSAYIEACGIAPSTSPARWARAPACSRRRGAGAPDRQGDRLHRLAQPRPGPRDHLRAGGGRQAGHPDGRRRHRARRHRQGACSAWAPTAAARWRWAARPSSRRSTRSSPRARRSPPTCWRRRHRHRVRERRVQGGRHRQEGALRAGGAHRLRAAQLPARQAGAGPERERVLRPDQLHLPRPAPTSARSRSTPPPARSPGIDRSPRPTTSATSSTR
jgi:hypothetical protein